MPKIPVPHPFAPVRPKRTLKFYLVWTLQILAAPILVPVRVAMLVLCLTVMEALLRLVSRGVDFSKPVSPLRRGLLGALLWLDARLFLINMGYYRIHEVNKQYKPDPERANVIISNHVTCMDPVAFVSIGFHSFMSKAEVAKMPFFGYIGKVCQTVFVDRGDKKSKAASIRAVDERVAHDIHEMGHKRLWPAMVILPEGTTCNGTCLAPFKKGAFVPGKPVSPMYLRYRSDYVDCSDASMDMVKAAFRVVMCFYTRLEVVYLPEYVPDPVEVKDPDLYAENVRRYMAERLGLPTSEMCFWDKRHFGGWSDNYERCSEAYKAVCGPGRRRKDGYYTEW